MKDLKPKLMISHSGRRSSGGGIGSILTFLIVFFVGFYTGNRYEDIKAYLSDSGEVATQTENAVESDSSQINNPDSTETLKEGNQTTVETMKPGVIQAYENTAILTEKDISGSVSSGSEENLLNKTGEQGEFPGIFTLQVAAYEDLEEARSVASIYRDKGYDAYSIQLENSRGEVWSLVRIGKYDTNELALYNAELFKAQEGQQVLIQTFYEIPPSEDTN